MKAGDLGAQLLALPPDTGVVIDGGEGVGELPVRWTGMGKDGKFGIRVVVPEANEAAYRRTLGIEPTAPEPMDEPPRSGAVVAWLDHDPRPFVATWDPSKGQWFAGDGWLLKWLDGMTGAPMPARPTAPAPWRSGEPPADVLAVDVRTRPNWTTGTAWRERGDLGGWGWSHGGDGGHIARGCWPDHWQWRAVRPDDERGKVEEPERPSRGTPTHGGYPTPPKPGRVSYTYTGDADAEAREVVKAQSARFATPTSIPRGGAVITLDAPERPPIAFVHPDEHAKLVDAFGALRLIAITEGAVDAVEMDEDIRQLVERGESYRVLDAVVLDAMKVEHERVKLQRDALQANLSEWRELAADIIGIKGGADGVSDELLRAALLAETEQMAREALATGRLERRLEEWRAVAKGIGFGTDDDDTIRAVLCDERDKLGRDLAEATPRAEYIAEGRRLEREEVRMSAERGRADGIEARLSLKGRPSDLYKEGDAYWEATRAGWDAIDGQLQHVHDGALEAGVERGRQLEREEADRREQTHDEDVQAALSRAEDRAHLAATREGCAARLRGIKRGDHVYVGDAHARSHAEGWDNAEMWCRCAEWWRGISWLRPIPVRECAAAYGWPGSPS